MLKINYTSEPYYYNNVWGINDTSTKNLEITFADDSATTEIIAQIIKLLEFMGYSRQTKKQWLNMIEDLTCDGYLINDIEEKED